VVLPPQSTPAVIAAHLNAVMSAALETAAVRARREALGLSVPEPARPVPNISPGRSRARSKKWAPGIKASRYSAD